MIISNLAFTRLNDDWNAEPNAPCEKVKVSGSTVQLTFFLNPWTYVAVEKARKGA